VRFSLLQRRLFRELFFLFSLCLGSLLSLILIGRILQLRDLFLSLGLTLLDLGLLFFYLSPFFLLLLIPVACMLSVFLTFLRMSTDRELIALKSGGLSLYQLTPAPLLFCLLCCALTLFTSLYGVSWGMSHFRSAVVGYAKTKAQLVLQPGVFNKEFPGLMVFAQKVNIDAGELENIIVEDQSRKSIMATILAPAGRFKTVPGKGQVLIALDNGRIYQQEKDKVSVLSFDSYQVRLDLTRMLKGFTLDEEPPKEMSWEKLLALRDNPEASKGRDAKYLRKLALEIHKRWVFPMACLVLGLFALPLACSFEGLKRHYGAILALGCFLVYYTMLSIGLSLGEAGVLPPSVGLWIPNVAFLAAGLIGLRLTAQERSLLVDAVRRLRARLRARS
jgi:lipopolysaccharide export system permease protein